MGLAEAAVVAALIAGAFYLMNQERARAAGTTARLRSSTASLFAVVMLVVVVTGFFLQGCGPRKGGERPAARVQAGGCGALSETPLCEAMRFVDLAEPYF